MRIALFADTYFEFNGVAKTLQRLVEWCKTQKNIKIDVYTFGQEFDVVNTDNVRIFIFPPRKSFKYYEELRWEFKMHEPRQVFYENEYDVVHVVAPGSLGWFGLNAARKRGIPVMGTYHTSLAEYASVRVNKILKLFANKIAWLILKSFYSKCDRVLVPTQSISKELYDRAGIRSGIFSRGVDNQRFKPELRNKKNDQITILYAGRLSPEKNLDVLPMIYEYFKGRSDVNFVILGDGPRRSRLQSQMPKATFKGFLSGDAFPIEYANADVFVFPSLTDTFGNVIIEAASSGVPTVAFDAPGPRDIIVDHVTGFIVKNETGFIKDIDILINNDIIRHKMGKEAREHVVRNHSWTKIFKELENEYRKLCRN